ncbi:MAG: hypothetical protein NUW02_01890 [Candidatus Campbellbacteria bacterium]|nr:hypothetical protein [Candidatus Campbellbacteria bacterium]
MKLSIKELLDFFDDKKNSQKGDASALMAILGEDMNAAVYKHFRKNGVEILDDSVLPGTNKGNRLDRWVVDKKYKKLYQCEIKNWAATAIGGQRLNSNADSKIVKKIVEYHWKRELSSNFSKNHEQPNGVTKVLLSMRKLLEYQKFKVEPLLIYWMPISSDKKDLNPLSVLPIKSLHLPIKSQFKKLHIFSVSLYLRQLLKKGRKTIDLEMPHFEHRMTILARFQNKK